MQSRRFLYGVNRSKAKYYFRRSFITVKIPEEVDKSLGESKKVRHDKLFEILSPMEDIPHHGTVILHVFNDPFQHNKYAQDYRIQRFLN